MKARPKTLSLWVLALATLTATAAAQDRRWPRGFGRRGFGPQSQNPDDLLSGPGSTNLYSLPRNEDAWFSLKEAVDELRDTRYRSALERLQKILDSGDHSLVETELHSGEPRDADKVYESLRRAALRVLSRAPEAARSEYDAQTTAATGLRVEDLGAATSVDTLTMLARRFPCSSHGLRALRLLGDLLLERGEAEDALAHFLRLLDLLPTADTGLLQRIALCRHLLGRGAGELKGDATPAPVAGTPLTLAAFRQALGQPKEAQLPRDRGLLWPNLAAPGADRGTMDPPERGAARQWGVQRLGDEGVPEDPEGFSRLRGFLVHPVADGDRVYVTTGNWAACYNVLSGERLEFKGPLLDEDPRLRGNYHTGINPSFTYAGALGRTGGDDDVFVCALLVPETGQFENRFYNGNPIMKRLPVRRLFALHARSFKLLWKHWNGPGEAGAEALLQRAVNVCGVPLVHGDRIYVPTIHQTGTISLHLSCFDLRTGQPVFQTLLMSAGAEVNMFGNAMQEYTASPLLWHDGTLYGTSNLGLAYALDADGGAVRWMSRYESIPYQHNIGLQTRLRPVFWMNNPPAVSDGVVVMTPIDARDALAFDTLSGLPLWSLSCDQTQPGQADSVRFSQLLGALDGRFVFSGLGIGTVRPRPPQLQYGRRAVAEMLRQPDQLDDPAPRDVMDVPRGTLAGHAIYYLTARGILHVLDGKGETLPTPIAAGNIPRPGNLFMTRGTVVITTNDQVQGYFAPERLRERARREASERPTDPAAQRKLGDLLRGDAARGGQVLDEALRCYERALELARKQGLGDDHPETLRIRSGLFEVLLERAGENQFLATDGALKDLRRARDAAPGLQRRLLAWDRLLTVLSSRPRELLAELRALERECPEESFRFGEQDTVRVALYCPWRIARILGEPDRPESDPAGAVAAWQRLLRAASDDDTLDREPARTLARRAIGTLIIRHGATVYAPFETAARDQLARARTPEALRQLTRDYPNATATQEARRLLADAAAAKGDLAQLAEFAAEGGSSVGLMRRTAAAALAAGNDALARALLARLEKDHGDTASDFAPDQGRSLREVFAALPPPPAAPPPPALPTTALASQRFPGNERVELLGLQLAAGVRGAAPLPLLVLRGGHIEAYDPKPQADGSLAPPRWSTPDGLEVRRPVPGAAVPALLAGPSLMVLTGTGVEAFRVADGQPAWRRPFASRDVQVRATLRDGMLVVWEGVLNQAERGRLWAVEPSTGALLWQRALNLEQTAPPTWARRHALFPDSAQGRFRALLVDLLTGEELPRFEPSSALLARSGIAGELRRETIREERLLALDDAVVLHEASQRSGERLLCIDFACTQVRWSHELAPGFTLKKLLAYGNQLALLQSGNDMSGRLTLLDAQSGRSTRPPIPLGRAAHLVGYQDGDPEPEWLAVCARPAQPQTLELTLVALTGNRDARAVPIKGFELPADGSAPANLGGPWLALVVRRASNDRAPSLVTLDPTRRDLPTLQPLRPPTFGPYHLQRVADTLAVQSQDAILLFGPGK